MPPKSRTSKAAAAAKRPAAAHDDEPPAKAARADASGTNTKKKHKVDANFRGGSDYRVYEDDAGTPWSAMLNQVDIGANANKFYGIQCLTNGTKGWFFGRYGRVGEVGVLFQEGPVSLDAAKKAFEEKFKAKSGSNSWAAVKDAPDQFKVKSGKYQWLVGVSMGGLEDDDVVSAKSAAAKDINAGVKPSKLESHLQSFMNVITDKKMFEAEMSYFSINVDRLPLGKLQKEQLDAGLAILEEIDKLLKGKTKPSAAQLEKLSSQFYTLIPLALARSQRPPTIDSIELLDKKYDLVNTLTDICLAQEAEKAAEKKQLEPNPIDRAYKQLAAKLEYVDPKSKEYTQLETYAQQTANNWRKMTKIKAIFRVEMPAHEKKMKQRFEKVGNRKLLWHGTSAAVVQAILGSSMRIMPNSGGRLGRGLYYASENGKSSCYTRAAPSGDAFMFLVEVPLGDVEVVKTNMCHFNKDEVETKLKKDSVLGIGRTEPDPSKNITIKSATSKHPVVMPQGKPVENKAAKDSHFSQSEYLIYDQERVTIRYVFQIDFN